MESNEQLQRMSTTPEDRSSLGPASFVEAAQRSVLKPVSHPRPIIVIGAGGIARDAHLPAYRKASLPVASAVDAEISKACALAKDFDIAYATNSIQEALAHTKGDVVFDLAVPAP